MSVTSFARRNEDAEQGRGKWRSFSRELSVLRSWRPRELRGHFNELPAIQPDGMNVLAEREGFYTAIPKFPTRLPKSLLLRDRVSTHF